MNGFSNDGILIDDSVIPVQNVADPSPSACGKDRMGQRICSGSAVIGGKILAVFSTGYVVFQDTSANVISAAARNYERQSSPENKTVEVSEAKLSENCDTTDDIDLSLNSPNLSKFREILRKGEAASSIEDFLILWNPKNDQPDIHSYFDDCADSENGMAPIRGNSHIFEECKPDALYSWGPFAKILTFQKTMPSNNAWSKVLNPGFDGIWSTVSPTATTIYGEFQVRIKPKRSSNFRLFFGNNNDYKRAYPGAVNVATWPNTAGAHASFIFYVGETIESWSYGTAEQYDEIIKDLRRRNSSKTWVGWDMREYKEPISDAGYPREIAKAKELKHNLFSLIQLILNRKGGVFYAPGTCPSRKQHFSTDRPTYFKAN